MAFFSVVDRVARNLDHQVGPGDFSLTGQARGRGQSPGAIQKIFLGIRCGVKGGEPFSHDDVAGRAGTRHFAGVLDVDIMVEQNPTNGLTLWGIGNFGTLRADFRMRENSNFWHLLSCGWFRLRHREIVP